MNTAPTTNNQTLEPKNLDELQQLATETPRKAVNTVSQEFQNFLADIETLAKSITSLTGKELDAARAQLSERIAAAKVTIAEVRSNLTQQTQDTIALTDTYVREQPWKAVGIGTTIGFLLGLALARRH